LDLDGTIVSEDIHFEVYRNILRRYGIDFTKANIIVGFLAGLFQYVQIRLSLQNMSKVSDKPISELKPEEIMQKQMSFMMKYFIPVIIFIASLKVSAAVALYWIVSSLFMIVQKNKIAL
jgi:membrane protein insertase Oxa1/YidC/SpoIIIJ